MREAGAHLATLTVLLACLLSPPTTATQTPPPASLQPLSPHLPNHQPPPPPPPPPAEPASRVAEVRGTYTDAKKHNQPPLSNLVARLLALRLSQHRKTPSPSSPSSKLLTGPLLKNFQQDRHSPAPPPSKRPANPLLRNPFHHTETQAPAPPAPQHAVRVPLEKDSDHLASSLLGLPLSGGGVRAAGRVDGVPLSQLPPHLVLAAYIREKALRRTSRSSSLQRRTVLGVGDSVAATTASGLDATAFCQTEECVRLMQEYEQWRRQNGYGTSGGRWG